MGTEERRSKVWMVSRRTGPDGAKGELVLGQDEVTFRPEDGSNQTAFPLTAVRRAKKVMGSPVLEIHLNMPGAPSVVGFYFVKPPSLEAPDGPHLFRRRYARKTAVVKLRQWNAVKRDEIAGWVEAIRTRR